MDTIYIKATKEITEEISRYLDLINQSHSFQDLKVELFDNVEIARLFANGIGVDMNEGDINYKEWLIGEYNRKVAVKFDIESAVTAGVYRKVRAHVSSLYDLADSLTERFTKFDQAVLFENPEILPVFQNLLNLSKAQLVKKIGSVSDTGLSRPGALRLAELLQEKIKGISISKASLLQRIEITIEGIVRDLVGRVLFEEVVANALIRSEVPHLREDQYSSLSGVVYDMRADFVIPDEKNPIAFIEVRKSSSRHASLYAKDKMFSAINWKGQHKNLVGVIIVEGDWTQATLQAMSNIFDYVVPLEKINDLANVLKRATKGDETILKWLVDFKITKSPNFR